MRNRLQIAPLTERFRTQTHVTRRELKQFYRSMNPTLQETTFRWMIMDLVSCGLLAPAERGLFYTNWKHAPTEGIEVQKPSPYGSYEPVASVDLLDIANGFRNRFSELEYCIWDTRWLNEFMLHQPARFFTLFECERVGLQTAFEHLRSRRPHVFLEPTASDLSNYVYENSDSIVVRRLVSQAPLSRGKTLHFPKLEKVLVDLVADDDLYYAYQGAELDRIFSSAIRSYWISEPTLKRYSNRRSCSEKVSQILERNHLLEHS